MRASPYLLKHFNTMKCGTRVTNSALMSIRCIVSGDGGFVVCFVSVIFLLHRMLYHTVKLS